MGAVLAVAGSRSATASAPAGTSGLSDDDLANIAVVIGYELAAEQLYEHAIAAGADDPLWAVLARQHAAYADGLAGISGISADSPNTELVDQYATDFDTSDPAAAGYQLESVTSATNVELLGVIVDVNTATAMASIAAMESRQAAVLVGLSGQGDDFDALFVNSATPRTPGAPA
jgi:hypothetical protein